MKKLKIEKCKFVLRFALIITGAFFLLVGMNRGESDITLMKAIFICLECIGIG